MTEHPGGGMAYVSMVAEGVYRVMIGDHTIRTYDCAKLESVDDSQGYHAKKYAEDLCDIINAAHDKAVREATEKLQAHNDHLQRMFNLPSARKDIAEAEARVWEEAARIVDGFNDFHQLGSGSGSMVKQRLAPALRSKKESP